MVILRIWAFKPQSLAIGHASLEVGVEGDSNYRYISVWPSGKFDNKGSAVTKAFDFKEEGGDSWYQESYLRLNERAMAHYWDRLALTNSLTYSNFMYGFNCMTNVALFLMVGQGYDPIDDIWRIVTIQEHWSLMWFSKGVKDWDDMRGSKYARTCYVPITRTR